VTAGEKMVWAQGFAIAMQRPYTPGKPGAHTEAACLWADEFLYAFRTAGAGPGWAEMTRPDPEAEE
jgi:hypothetical protein